MNSFTYPGLNSTLVSTMPSEFIDVNGTCLMFCQINEQSERVVTLYNPLITHDGTNNKIISVLNIEYKFIRQPGYLTTIADTNLL